MEELKHEPTLTAESGLLRINFRINLEDVALSTGRYWIMRGHHRLQDGLLRDDDPSQNIRD